MTKLPRLYVGDAFSRIVNPISVQITQNIEPLSTASMTLPEGEELPTRSYAELFTPYGSAGFFRVRSPKNNYGEGFSTAELEHMVAEVGDYVVKDELSKMISAKEAVKLVFGHYKGKHWQLGNYNDIGTAKIALEAKYDSVLNVLLSILEQKPECMMSFDFTASPWKLNIVKRGTSVVAEGRLSRNVTSATVTYDDSELVTRVWYQTFDSEGKGTWTSKDADTKKTYGVIESTVNTSPDMDADEINTTVNKYISEHKNPKTSVSIQAEELSQITGERMDKFVLGDLYRLNLRDYNLTVELHVTSIVWSDVYNNPDSVSVHLGEEEDTVVTFLHNLDATGAGTSGGAGGGRSAAKAGQQATSFQQNFFKTDEYGNILEQAGMYLDSKGLLVYAESNENGNYIGSKFKVASDQISAEVTARKKDGEELSSRIDIAEGNITAEVTRATEAEGSLSGRINVQADRVDLVVEKKDGANVIKAASICVAINNSGESEATINADKIYLLGNTIANKITADYVANKVSLVANLTAQKISADSLTVKPVAGMGAVNVATAYNGSSLTLNGNTYTLLLAKMNGSYDEYSFSRATSLSGKWSSGTYKVTASPQGNTISTKLQVLSASGNTTANGTRLTQKFVAYYGPDDEHLTSTGFSQNIVINANNFLQAKTVYDSGTVTADDGYIGLKSVNVQVSSYPRVDGISVGNIAINTTQPTGYDGATQLTNLANAIKNNRNTYVWFLVKALDEDDNVLYTKAYYCASA